MEQEQAHDQHILLRALVDELHRCGLRDACTSPGSRSTPIVVPLVRHGGIRCWSHVDERSAGFFAVGAAKAGGRPGRADVHERHGGGELRAGRPRGARGGRARCSS
jgi:2-succinyl-5-enolpyruvyl-6-hydroxy-3-cyclohexene-1-carboxylate synthase